MHAIEDLAGSLREAIAEREAELKVCSTALDRLTDRPKVTKPRKRRRRAKREVTPRRTPEATPEATETLAEEPKPNPVSDDLGAEAPFVGDDEKLRDAITAALQQEDGWTTINDLMHRLRHDYHYVGEQLRVEQVADYMKADGLVARDRGFYRLADSEVVT